MIVSEKSVKERPNHKVQTPDETFFLKDVSIISGYSICGIERILEIKKIVKIDSFGYKYDYYERVYTYCFDLRLKGEYIKYYELKAKDVPTLRKIVKKIVERLN